MSGSSDEALRRAERLVRWYPKGWRSHYGDEFAELLAADIFERPRSWRRDADVLKSGLVARLTTVGLSGHALEPLDQVRTSLVTLGCAAAVFLAFGMAMWAQLTIGWQWAEPNTRGTFAAMVVMCASVLVLFVVMALAAVPIAGKVVTLAVHRRAKGLVRPSMLFVAGLGVLVLGARHFANGWPGTGGHPWFHQGLVPGGVAAFTWASTLSVSSYWAHPGALGSFPIGEVTWMAVSPVAMVCLVVGAAKTARRLDLSPRVLGYESCLAHVAALGMAVFLAGSCSWIFDGGSGPQNLFHPGAIDVAEVLAMTAALAVAFRATHRAHRDGLAFLTG